MGFGIRTLLPSRASGKGRGRRGIRRSFVSFWKFMESLRDILERSFAKLRMTEMDNSEEAGLYADGRVRRAASSRRYWRRRG